MAIRKATIQKQMAEKLGEFAPPGEQIQVAFQAITGPSPWVDSIPYVRFATIFIRKYYCVMLTNTSLVIVECSRWTGRPQTFVCAEHLSTAFFTDMQLNTLWSKVFYRMPTTGAAERLNVHRQWREELDALVSRLPQQPAMVG